MEKGKYISIKNNGKDVVYPLHINQSIALGIQSGKIKYGIYFMYKCDSKQNAEEGAIRIGEYYPTQIKDDYYDKAEVTPLTFDEDMMQDMVNGNQYEILIRFVLKNGYVDSLNLLPRKTFNPKLN